MDAETKAADDDNVITREWLVSSGWRAADSDCRLVLDAKDRDHVVALRWRDGPNECDDDGREEWYFRLSNESGKWCRDVWLPEYLYTRGQLRRLVAALKGE